MCGESAQSSSKSAMTMCMAAGRCLSPTRLQQSCVTGPLRLGRQDHGHGVVPIAGEHIAARLKDTIGAPFTMPASSTPAINAAKV
mmetsp:Transcript_66793/g.124805  ORF Transcript_66793/g.124805 Transcript_66793/m.124805 type:complete len:85 (+) Transcript_66793:73-327(+)